jgi:hypothetical protein
MQTEVYYKNYAEMGNGLDTTRSKVATISYKQDCIDNNVWLQCDDGFEIYSHKDEIDDEHCIGETYKFTFKFDKINYRRKSFGASKYVSSANQTHEISYRKNPNLFTDTFNFECEIEELIDYSSHGYTIIKCKENYFFYLLNNNPKYAEIYKKIELAKRFIVSFNIDADNFDKIVFDIKEPIYKIKTKIIDFLDIKDRESLTAYQNYKEMIITKQIDINNQCIKLIIEANRVELLEDLNVEYDITFERHRDNKYIAKEIMIGV